MCSKTYGWYKMVVWKELLWSTQQLMQGTESSLHSTLQCFPNKLQHLHHHHSQWLQHAHTCNTSKSLTEQKQEIEESYTKTINLRLQTNHDWTWRSFKALHCTQKQSITCRPRGTRFVRETRLPTGLRWVRPGAGPVRPRVTARVVVIPRSTYKNSKLLRAAPSCEKQNDCEQKHIQANKISREK